MSFRGRWCNRRVQREAVATDSTRTASRPPPTRSVNQCAAWSSRQTPMRPPASAAMIKTHRPAPGRAISTAKPTPTITTITWPDGKLPPSLPTNPWVSGRPIMIFTAMVNATVARQTPPTNAAGLSDRRWTQQAAVNTARSPATTIGRRPSTTKSARIWAAPQTSPGRAQARAIKSNLSSSPRWTAMASAMKAPADPHATQDRLISLARLSGGAALGQHSGERLPQDLQIEGKRPVFDIAEIEPYRVVALEV